MRIALPYSLLFGPIYRNVFRKAFLDEYNENEGINIKLPTQVTMSQNAVLVIGTAQLLVDGHFVIPVPLNSGQKYISLNALANERRKTKLKYVDDKNYANQGAPSHWDTTTTIYSHN